MDRMMDQKMKEMANEVEAIVKYNNQRIKNLLTQSIEDAMQAMSHN